MRYMVIAAGILLAFGLTVSFTAMAAETKSAPEQFTIDEYDFEWTVAKSGDAKFVVEKTQEATTVYIKSGDMGYLNLTPKDAEAIGTALAKTDQYWKTMKGSETDTTERVPVGKYVVTFSNDPKYGFSVSIREAERFSMSSVSLKRDQAKKLAPSMSKAVALAAFVDDKIAF